MLQIRLFLQIVFIFFVVVAFLLAVPFLTNDATKRPLLGPSLDQVEYEEITFRNGDLELAGMLLLPSGTGPFPGAVFIHGSGTSRRDNAWYLTFARELQQNGVAVLLPDKRGSENSAGDWRDTSFEELAADTVAALDFLGTVPFVEPQRIGVVGFSQGGWIAPVVGAGRSDLAFVASISGAGVNTEEQLWFEEVNNIIEMGTYRILARLIAQLTVPSIKQRDTWRATAGFDPMVYWPEVQAPSFAAFGGGDTNIPVEESIERFEALARDVIVAFYPDGGHGISDPETGRVQQALLDDLTSFLQTHAEN